MIFNPVSGNLADVINHATFPRLCCANGQSQAISGYTLGQVLAYVADGQNTPLDPTQFGGPNGRTANPDANRNWKFSPATGNELPVPAPADENRWKTLHVRSIYSSPQIPGNPPNPPLTGDESVNWQVHQAAACGTCPP